MQVGLSPKLSTPCVLKLLSLASASCPSLGSDPPPAMQIQTLVHHHLRLNPRDVFLCRSYCALRGRMDCMYDGRLRLTEARLRQKHLVSGADKDGAPRIAAGGFQR